MVRKLFPVYFLLTVLLAACAPQAVPSLPPETPVTQLPSPVSIAPTETVPAIETPVPNSEWVSYRDPRYGIGLAYPCWWAFMPMPTEGSGGAINLRSFDEDYFRAHSTKGNWNNSAPPEGVLALDIVVFEDIDPALSTVEAWALLTDPDMSAIASAEERTIGQNTATVVQMLDLNNSSDPPSTLYLYRLAPDKLLMVNPIFQDRLDAGDVQGVLNSLSLSPDQPIPVPAFAPHDPLIAAACAGK